MAQLNDTMVQGDLRVTGKIYGTDNAIRLGNANLAIPPLGDGDQVGSTGDFFIDSGSGKNLPDTTNNFNIHTTVTHFNGTTYRLSQIATPTSATNPTGIYERGGTSSDGITWTFGNWASYNNYTLPLAASGTRGGIKIGYSESGTNYAVKLSSEKAYVSVPWTDTKVTQTKDDSGKTAYPLLMAGATDPNGSATTARYDSGVKLTPSTNTISANISGTADKAYEATSLYDSTSSGASILAGVQTHDQAHPIDEGKLEITSSSTTSATLKSGSLAFAAQGGGASISPAGAVWSNYSLTSDGLTFGTNRRISVSSSTGNPIVFTDPTVSSGDNRTILSAKEFRGQATDFTSDGGIAQAIDALIDGKLSVTEISSANPNFNTLTTQGVYNVLNAAMNVNGAPEPGQLNVIVLRSDATSSTYFVTQLAFGDNIYYRKKLLSTSTPDFSGVDWKFLTVGYKMSVGSIGGDANTIYFA